MTAPCGSASCWARSRRSSASIRSTGWSARAGGGERDDAEGGHRVQGASSRARTHRARGSRADAGLHGPQRGGGRAPGGLRPYPGQVMGREDLPPRRGRGRRPSHGMGDVIAAVRSGRRRSALHRRTEAGMISRLRRRPGAHLAGLRIDPRHSLKPTAPPITRHPFLAGRTVCQNCFADACPNRGGPTRDMTVSQAAKRRFPKDRKNKASIVMVAGISVRSLSGSTSVRAPTNRTNRGRGDAISSRQTGRHVGKALESAGHGRRGAAGMGCTGGRSQDRAGEGEAGGWVRGAWSGGAAGVMIDAAGLARGEMDLPE